MNNTVAKVKMKIQLDEQGFIATEFIFALTMAAGIGIALFAITYTLTVAEVAQYVAFATARSQAAAHIDIDSQKKRGLDSYKKLMSDKTFKSLFTTKQNSNAWFSLPPVPEQKLGQNEGDIFSEYPVSQGRVPNTGIRIKFVSKILNMKLPLLGRLMGEESDGLNANVTSFQFREPTQTECQKQMALRYSSILNLDGRFNAFISTSKSTNNVISMEDNGC